MSDRSPPPRHKLLGPDAAGKGSAGDLAPSPGRSLSPLHDEPSTGVAERKMKVKIAAITTNANHVRIRGPADVLRPPGRDYVRVALVNLRLPHHATPFSLPDWGQPTTYNPRWTSTPSISSHTESCRTVEVIESLKRWCT